MATSAAKPACKHLVLDAGPLLSLSPLRGLAETYYTVPQVLDELKDKHAREHFERLGLSAGVSIKVQRPEPAALAHVIEFAKKTGDYSVLSNADICVLALTYGLDLHESKNSQSGNSETQVETEASAQPTPAASSVEGQDADIAESVDLAHDDEDDATEPPESEASDNDEVESEAQREGQGSGEQQDHGQELDNGQSTEPLDVELQRLQHPDDHSASSPASDSPASSDTATSEPQPLYSDPSDSDDGEGEWITPSNVALHKSRALELLPSAADSGRGKGKGKQETIAVGCMTADFAMQNVLLQMGLGLVGVEGKRIERVKSWVLRCHACFKMCKDSSRKFCPSCGNPSLLRASVTISSPNAGPNTPAMQVHLKKNFQYKTRGTIYSIPAPKAGSAKTGPGEGLILREDQSGWVRAKKHADGKREREEKRMLNAASRSAVGGQGGAVLGSWMDPDWVPEILSAGASGKGRSVRSRGMDGDMPQIGYGRKNPNEKRRTK